MNRESPPFYVEPSTEVSVSTTKELISHINTLSSASSSSSSALVQPILTPRFAISCTPDLLSSLGDLAATDPSLRIQTHISENPTEVKVTHDLFPNASSYADVYDSHNLLRHNTILAHGVYLTQEELELIKTRGAGISHCPTSNFNLSSGVAKVGSWLDMGLKVGLGTDVSGGFAPSILTAIQHASIAAKVVSLQATPSNPGANKSKSDDTKFSNKQLTIPALLYLATLGGARVCDLEPQIGSFVPGKSFDALVVNVSQSAGNPGLWVLQPDEGKKRDLDGELEKFLFCGDDRNIKEVYVSGRLVGGTGFKSVGR
jgi:guanine deaminase